MSEPIRIHVDPTNPGQFFACCGLLELADRLWAGAEGWFEGGTFFVEPLDVSTAVNPTLGDLMNAVAETSLVQVDPDDDCASPIELPAPFDLRLDWWNDNRAGGAGLKGWAGRMSSIRIARAMKSVLVRPELQGEALLDHGMVVYDLLEPDKKVEPFYFDARRGANARSIDIGFMPDSLSMTTTAYPAVEFLCLVGLQRYRPLPTDTRRVFDYFTWAIPISARVAPSAVCGLLAQVDARGFRFENAYRTDQRKHKAFTPGTPLTRR